MFEAGIGVASLSPNAAERTLTLTGLTPTLAASSTSNVIIITLPDVSFPDDLASA